MKKAFPGPAGSVCIPSNLHNHQGGRIIVKDRQLPSGSWSRTRALGILVAAISGAVASGATFTVINTNDAGAGSFREAISHVNESMGPHTIAFAIPPLDGSVKAITPASGLPAIVNSVTINGYTQPGSSLNTVTNGDNAVLLIELDGSRAGQASGLILNTSNSVIRGLVIHQFGVCGIQVAGSGQNLIEGNFIGTDPTGRQARGNLGAGLILSNSANNLIGGTTPGARNVLSGNTRTNSGDSCGIDLFDSGCISNRIQGNFIGVDATGTNALPNDDGGIILFGSTYDLVGGTNVGAGNLISGNLGAGLLILATRTTVQGNLIGTDITGTKEVHNGAEGILINGGTDCLIGGTDARARNIISGNDWNALSLVFSGGRNIVEGNFIGTDASGTSPLGNDKYGVFIAEDANNTIGGTEAGRGNVIAFNKAGGIFIGGEEVSFAAIEAASSTNNAILGNSIFENGGLGIDLSDGLAIGVTANDPCDSDSGGNQLQNHPEMTLASNLENGIVIQGLLDSNPNTTFRLEFFANNSCGTNGFGEGEIFVGFTNVTTDANCTNVFEAILPDLVASGSVVTATATDPFGNTSEFSACQPVVWTPPRPTHDFAITSLKAPATITLSAAKPAITKPIKVQIQNLGTNSEIITAAALSNDFVSLTVSNLHSTCSRREPS